MIDHREDLRMHLVEHAYRSGVDIVLASGQRSDWYVDCRQVTMDQTGLRIAARTLVSELERLHPGHTRLLVAGVLDGGAPLAIGVTIYDAAVVPILVRKQAKAHGKGGRLVCTDRTMAVACGSEVILLEDVVTTGGSVVRASDALLEEADATVRDVIALVDREEGAREHLREHGMELHALFRRQDLWK